MKKYIAIATLLAVGSAFANAAELLWSADMTTGTYAFTMGSAWTGDAYAPQTKWGSQTFVDGKGVQTNGDNKVSFETVNAGLPSSVEYPGIKLSDEFSLQFFVDLTSADSSASAYLCEISESLSWGFYLKYDANSDQFSFVAGSGTYTFTDSTSNATIDSLSGIKSFTITMENKGEADNDGRYSGLLSAYAGDTLIAQATMAAGNRHSTSTVKAGLSFLNKREGSDGVAGIISSVSLYTGIIPEPSTFGLLAGLGALALVGTRRRRK